MNKTIRSGTREVIYKVFIRFLAEFQAGKLLTNLQDVYKRTADMTGKSESTVRRIVAEGSTNKGKFKKTDFEAECSNSDLPSTSRQEPLQDLQEIEETMSGVDYLDFEILEDD